MASLGFGTLPVVATVFGNMSNERRMSTLRCKLICRSNTHFAYLSGVKGKCTALLPNFGWIDVSACGRRSTLA